MHDRGVRVSGIAKHLGVDHHTAAKALGCSVRVDCGWVRFRALAALVLVPAVARFRPLLPVGPVVLGRLRTARRCSYRRISSCLRRLPFSRCSVLAFRSACGAPLALCARSLARRRIRLSSAPGLFLAFGALAFRALSALPRLLEALFPPPSPMRSGCRLRKPAVRSRARVRSSARVARARIRPSCRRWSVRRSSVPSAAARWRFCCRR